MASYYIQMCSELHVNSEEESDWIISLSSAMSEFENMSVEETTEFHKIAQSISDEFGVTSSTIEVTKERDDAGNISVLFSSEEFNDPYVVGLIVMKYFEKFNIPDIWISHFAYTCSRMEPDAFSGGVVVVSCTKCMIETTMDLASSIIDRHF